jgi:hypothetical protein
MPRGAKHAAAALQHHLRILLNASSISNKLSAVTRAPAGSSVPSASAYLVPFQALMMASSPATGSDVVSQAPPVVLAILLKAA